MPPAVPYFAPAELRAGFHRAIVGVRKGSFAMKSLIETNDTFLYDAVSDRIGSLIDRGTLRPGQRVPSVRELSAQLNVSISTVLQAYRTLETRGRIEARPQSGYYVRTQRIAAAPEPEQSRPASSPTKVSVGELVMRMLKASAETRMIPLGAAIPSPSYLPTQQLNRIQSAIARRSARGSGTYDIPPGVRELRVQIARRYLEAGCALSPDDLITTCGCQEALSLCLRAVAKSGEIVAIESPTYYGHLQTLDALGLRAMEISTCPRTGICLDALRDALQSRSIKAVLLVATCHNPLGSIMPDEKKRALVELLKEFDVPLIEDDVYGELAYARPRPKACKAFDCAPDSSVLLCGSFSKTLAPGARVGYAAPGKFRGAVERLKICTTLATPTLPQLALAEYLAGGAYDRHLRRMTNIYAENMRLVSAAVGKSFPDSTRVTRPAGGFVLWVEMPRHVDALELHARALAHKISIAPGPIFSAKGAYKNFIRLNCGYPFTDEIERAIFTLGRLAGGMAS